MNPKGYEVIQQTTQGHLWRIMVEIIKYHLVVLDCKDYFEDFDKKDLISQK